MRSKEYLMNGVEIMLNHCMQVVWGGHGDGSRTKRYISTKRYEMRRNGFVTGHASKRCEHVRVVGIASNCKHHIQPTGLFCIYISVPVLVRLVSCVMLKSDVLVYVLSSSAHHNTSRHRTII